MQKKSPRGCAGFWTGLGLLGLLACEDTFFARLGVAHFEPEALHTVLDLDGVDAESVVVGALVKCLEDGCAHACIFVNIDPAKRESLVFHV